MKIKKIPLLLFIGIVVALFLSWLAWNKVTFVFSLAAYGYNRSPKNFIYVFLNAFFLVLFIIFINFRGKVNWRSSSVYLAFIIALYVEMYGLPLTMYVLMWCIGFDNPGNLWYLLKMVVGEDLFIFIFYSFLLPISNILIFTGILLILFGWKEIFRLGDQLVTTGPYKYVRHPQYLGLILVTLGINFLWTTLSTFLLWPVLVALYYQLAKTEERFLSEKFGEKFQAYKATVPMFLPRIRLILFKTRLNKRVQ